MANKIDQTLSRALHEQYGAANKMLEKVIKKCPEDVWDDPSDGLPFWQVAHHTLWFLDYYLEGSKEGREGFRSRFPQVEPGLKPLSGDIEIITSQALLGYLDELKEKTKFRLESLNSTEAVNSSIFEWHGSSILSSLVYNLRHVMLHIGALNSRLLRRGIKVDNWVSHFVFE